MQSSIHKLVFVVVQVDKIGVNALVDTRATQNYLASSVACRSGLTIEAHDNVVASLNGRDH